MDFLQTLFAGLGLVVSFFVAYIAYGIGLRQNEINEIALRLQNYAEIFLMPQAILGKNGADVEVVGWLILLKNISAYPIYLNKYEINSAIDEIGKSSIPNNPESWYGIPIKEDVLKKKQFELIIFFEDYFGNKYKSIGTGKFNGLGWEIKTQKREEIK
jgi:hypothetical protein